jgi:hypothetical protein
LKTFGAYQPFLGQGAPALVHFSHRDPSDNTVGTDSPTADLYTWNPPSTNCNLLKKQCKKAEERWSIQHSFCLTNGRFGFMIVSVPGFTERLAEQDEDEFRALIRGEIERARCGEQKTIGRQARRACCDEAG